MDHTIRAVAILVALSLFHTEAVAKPPDEEPAVSAPVRCAIDPEQPICPLARGDIVQHAAGRVGFSPPAWAKVSAELKRLRADIADWPAHCDRLRANDRTECDKRIEAADAECDAKIEATGEAIEKVCPDGPPLWKTLVGVALAGIAAGTAAWCALDDQPGDWPCWLSAGSALGTVGLVVSF